VIESSRVDAKPKVVKVPFYVAVARDSITR